VREDYSAGGDAWSWSPEHGSGWYVVAANLSAEHSAARALPWPELGGGTARGHHVLALEGAAAGG
jgi:hypothetical protein